MNPNREVAVGYLEIPEFSWRPRLAQNREYTADDQTSEHPDDRPEAVDALGRLDGLFSITGGRGS